jgi:hypothetical protein
VDPPAFGISRLKDLSLTEGGGSYLQSQILRRLEMGRIVFPSQSRQKVNKTPFQQKSWAWWLGGIVGG